MLVKIEEMNKEEILIVSSRQVAEDFEKQHRHVLEAIREIEGYAENSAHLFIPTVYQNDQNKQQYPEYLLTRDDFSL